MRRSVFLFVLLASFMSLSCSTGEDITMYNVIASINPSDAGTISPAADSSYEEGEEITLKAEPSDGYVFDQWSGDKESSDRSLTFTVDQDYTISADFEIKEYELVTNTEGQGSVYEEIVEQKNKEYVHGTVVELTAEPDGGWKFVEWQGDVTGQGNPIEIAVENPGEITAVFETELNLETELIEWLVNQDRLVDAINWETPEGVINYRDWTKQQKEELDEMYLKVASNNLDMENYPPENHYTQKGEYVNTWIAKDDAWELYLMNIANSLYIEKNNKVGWSILSDEYSKADLEMLLNGRRLYIYDGVKDGTHIYDLGSAIVLPAQPNFVTDFFKSEGILVSDRKETIYRLIDWSAVHLTHYSGGPSLENFEAHWDYAGAVPVDKVIEGTKISPDINPWNTEGHWTAGCHGTNYFYRSILKTINIPVRYVVTSGHATPHFPLENFYLSHGDDPYNQFYQKRPAIPPEELLIDAETWNDWFGDNVSSDDKSNNIGRRVRELGVEYLSYYLLRQYCDDKEEGNTKEEGTVLEYLSRVYSLSELKEMNLWEKMEEKTSSLGGCSNIEWTGERPSYY